MLLESFNRMVRSQRTCSGIDSSEGYMPQWIDQFARYFGPELSGARTFQFELLKAGFPK